MPDRAEIRRLFKPFSPGAFLWWVGDPPASLGGLIEVLREYPNGDVEILLCDLYWVGAPQAVHVQRVSDRWIDGTVGHLQVVNPIEGQKTTVLKITFPTNQEEVDEWEAGRAHRPFSAAFREAVRELADSWPDAPQPDPTLAGAN